MRSPRDRLPSDVLEEYDKVIAARDFLSSRSPCRPAVGLVLGSGLGTLAGEVENSRAFPYPEIPHWPCGQVEGHRGSYAVGWVGQTPVAILSGRVHLYEGCSPAEVAFGIRVLGTIGVHSVILTNASGGINESWEPGRLALIADHIHLQGSSALLGPNDERFGPRFVDLSEPYCRKYRELARKAAAELNFDLLEGVYAAVLGPSYETPAEIRYLRAIGADMVGMSTVPETIVARHLGIKVLAISVLTNRAAGMTKQKLTHGEVLATAEQVAPQLTALLRKVIPRIGREGGRA